MSTLKISLVSNVKNPKGYIVSADDLGAIYEMAQLSLADGLDRLWAISSDVSLSNAQRIARHIASVSGGDAFVAGHPDSDGYGVSFGRIDTMEPSLLISLASFADESVAFRAIAFLSLKIDDDSGSEASHKKWFDIIFKMSKELGLNWKDAVEKSTKRSADDLGAMNSDSQKGKEKDLASNIDGYNEAKNLIDGQEVFLISSAITSVKYDKKRLMLSIKMTNGMSYLYSDVPASVYSELLSAESAGRYYVAEIRNKYEYNVLDMAVIENFKMNSQAIDEISHIKGDLYIKFHSGETYRYESVPKKVVMSFLEARSAMSFFREHIKNSYVYEKILR